MSRAAVAQIESDAGDLEPSLITFEVVKLCKKKILNVEIR